MRTNLRFAVVFCCCVIAAVEVSAAQIRASGAVRLPDFSESDLEQEPEMPGDPFARSIVSVARSGNDGGVSFGYSASSDIGLGELKAFGQLSNSTGGELSEIELGLVSANARLKDTITIESVSAEDYDVIFEFHVDGITDFNGGGGFAGGNISTGSFTFENDSFFTRMSQTIDETLSVTRTYNGTVEQDITLQLFLQLNVAGGGNSLSADLSNTATLTIILPQGVQITNSESGTFLEVITPIPLPSMFPLLLGICGWIVAQRSRTLPG